MGSIVDEIDLSLYSLEELNTLVERAKREINQKERRRLEDVRNQIDRLAQTLEIPLDEVIRVSSRRRRNGEGEGNVRFRNPANPEQTWSGRGKRPNWLQQALDRGANLLDFAVDD